MWKFHPRSSFETSPSRGRNTVSLIISTNYTRWRVFSHKIARYALRLQRRLRTHREKKKIIVEMNLNVRSLKRKSQNREENKYFARAEPRENSQTSCVWLNSRVTLVSKYTSAFEASTSLLCCRSLSVWNSTRKQLWLTQAFGNKKNIFKSKICAKVRRLRVLKVESTEHVSSRYQPIRNKLETTRVRRFCCWIHEPG